MLNVNYFHSPTSITSPHSRVALILSLSGTVDPTTLPTGIDGSFTIYEITLQGQEPGTDFLNRREDLREFRRVYRQALATIVRQHPHCQDLALFPAVPAPVAIACGYDLLPKFECHAGDARHLRPGSIPSS